MFVLQTLSKGNMQITSKKMLTEPDVKLKGKKVLSNDQNLNNLPAWKSEEIRKNQMSIPIFE